MKKLGVVGGLGPASSVYFYELLTNMTIADNDQSHIDTVIISKPSVPDRTAYLLGKSTDSPLYSLKEAVKQLEMLAMDYIAIPCVTAHYFYEQLAEHVEIPIINIIKETANYIKSQSLSSVGLLSTDGTIASNIFQKMLAAENIKTILPSKKAQQYVMELIYENIKANVPVETEKFFKVTDELKSNGAEAIVLGCTELSLIKRNIILEKGYKKGYKKGYIDVLEILAYRALTLCGANVRSIDA